MDPVTTMLLITNTINLMNYVMINNRPIMPPPQCDCHFYEDEKPKQVENKQDEKAVEEGNTKRC